MSQYGCNLDRNLILSKYFMLAGEYSASLGEISNAEARIQLWGRPSRALCYVRKKRSKQWQSLTAIFYLCRAFFDISNIVYTSRCAIMSKSDFSQDLLASSGKPRTAADKIPIIARGAVSERALKTLNLVSPSERNMLVTEHSAN